MKRIDYYILTKDYVLTKIEGRNWETHKFEDHFSSELPKIYPLEPVNIFDDPEVFMPAIKSIVKTTKRSFLSKSLRPNPLVVYIVDDLNSRLRKRLFIDGLIEANYKKVFLTEIGPSAVAAQNRDNYKKPSIVVSVIGKIIELSLCFGGTRIINHVIQSTFWEEFVEFEESCKEIQRRSLDECMCLDFISERDRSELKRIWTSSRKYEYVMASNKASIDTILDRRFKANYHIDFTQMTELMNDEFASFQRSFK
ncbi:hypothetical protein JYG23_08010 [Sedimentibacter sp. zth1]|uniref:hypothetical protein n=1 Tax=Sedimentibacter sp. zth1 TaxID=2816908 RepID=UPI001A912642|nr:hypothetical protein [Sedimentibacter sp. zth1]QSX04652.1 hypothetical protein JYG23_08010 [Sedimentibacter sp. zth1]